jgi:hypothetical protein
MNYQQIIDFLLDEGFTKVNENTYLLEDSEGLDHIGKSYEFCLHHNRDKHCFTRKLGDNQTKVYCGVEALSALEKIMKIRKAISEAERKGLYDISEHLTSEIDLDNSED